MRVCEAKVIVVGELNPYGADPRYSLWPEPRRAAGNRLRLIFGLTDLQYTRMLDRINLCAGVWRLKAARAAAWDIQVLNPRAVIVLLGAKVRSAFDFRGDLFTTVRAGEQVMVGLPHPSGRCRLWNEEGAVTRARVVLREAAPWVPWGCLDVAKKVIDDAETPRC
jgi:hypothetical protein